MNKRPDFALIDLDKVRKKKKLELTDLEKQEIEEALKLFDTDNDEQLDYHELKANIHIYFKLFLFYTYINNNKKK